MTKLTILDCSPVTLLLLLSLVGLSTCEGFSAPDDLFFVDGDKLSKYKLKTDNFIIDTNKMQDGKESYSVYLSSKKSDIIVKKMNMNKDNEKLENGDGAIVVGDGFVHLIGYSDEVDQPIQFKDVGDLYLKLKQAGKLGTITNYLDLPWYRTEAWPAKLVASTMGNNKQLLRNMSLKIYPDVETADKYLDKSKIHHREDKWLVEGYQSFLTVKTAEVIVMYMEKYIRERRLAQYNAKNMGKMSHTGIDSIITEVTSKFIEMAGKAVDSSFRITLAGFYQKTMIPIFDSEGLHKFLKEDLAKFEKNIILYTAIKTFPSGIKDGLKVTLSLSPTPTPGTEHSLGENVVDTILDFYRVYGMDKINADVKKAMENEYTREFLKNVKEKITDAVNHINDNILTKSYSTKFEDNEKQELIDELIREINVVDFFLDVMIEDVKPSIEEFVNNYIWYTVNYSMFGELVLWTTGNVDRFGSKRGVNLSAVQYPSIASMAGMNFVPSTVSGRISFMME